MNTKPNGQNVLPSSAKSFAKSTLKCLSLFTLASFLLTGCASSIRQSQIPMPANLVTPCPPIQEANAKNLGDLVVFTTDLINQYGECRAKHDVLVKALSNERTAF